MSYMISPYAGAMIVGKAALFGYNQKACGAFSAGSCL